MAFWIATAVQPCGISRAAQQPAEPAVVSALDAGNRQASPNHPHDPGPAGKHCPDATAAAAGVPSAAATPDHRDTPRMVQFAFEAYTLRLEHTPAHRNGILPAPAPRASLYLRNQRILI